jgi:hypothetical protein
MKYDEDDKYESARNSFIPEAEVFANDMMKDIPKGEAETKERESWNAGWNAAFHGKMNELVSAAGI